MDDIVAVEVRLATGERRYFLTWGRIQDHVDPAPLHALVLKAASGFGLGSEAVEARVCESVQEANGEPYFFEAFFGMCQERIPFGDEYEAWRKAKDQEMQSGKSLWYLGAKSA